MLRFTIVAACVAAAVAGCPNLCSGHGSCSGNDKCTCFANWQGADCSLRTCAFGNAWAIDAADPHGYEECSGAGICDRASGECKCFAGFTGYACQRSECPNDCSGHGVCRTLAEIKAQVPYSSSNWDADQLQACVCDPGFFGTDCSQRRCPTGDDPLTSCAVPDTVAIQEVRVTLGSKVTATHAANAATFVDVTYTPTTEYMDIFGTDATKHTSTVLADETLSQFKVGAVDVQGQVFWAPTSWKGAFSTEKSGSLLDEGASQLELALENIPNFKVRDVKVSGEYTDGSEATVIDGATTVTGLTSVIGKRYLVTFVPDTKNSANVGMQNPLVCETGYSCASAGCQPVVKMPFLYRYAAIATTAEKSAIDATPLSLATDIKFYTGDENSYTFPTTSPSSKAYIRLAAESQPVMPPGVAVDAGATAADSARYDIRVVIAVQGTNPSTQTPTVTGGDVYWTKVTYGHANIVADATEYLSTSTSKGVFAATTATDYVGTLKGFTYRGFIPGTTSGSAKVSLPDAPGIVLEFPQQDLVTTAGSYRFFEILVKLPTCDVRVLNTATDFRGVDNAVLAPIDPYLENVECSNRGQCDRATGQCACYEGYFGVACHRQTVLV